MSPKHVKRNEDLDFFSASGSTFPSPCKDGVDDNDEGDCDNDDALDSDGEYVYVPTGKPAAELTAELLRGDCRYPAYTVHFDRSFALDQVFPLLSHAELVAMALVSSNWFRFIHRGASELWKSLYERSFGDCKGHMKLCSAEQKTSFFSADFQLWACGKLEPTTQVGNGLNSLLPFHTHHPMEEALDWRKRYVWRRSTERIQGLVHTLGACGYVFHLASGPGHDLGALRQCMEGWLKTAVVLKEASADVLCEDLRRAALTSHDENAGFLPAMFDLEPLFQFRADFSRSVGYVGFTRVRGAVVALVLSPRDEVVVCETTKNIP